MWEKDDLEAMGMLKVDVLALGMLSAIRRSFDFVNGWRASTLQMHEIPDDDEAVLRSARKLSRRTEGTRSWH